VTAITTNYEWLTADEAAAYLKIPRRTLLHLVNQGKVKAYALSGTKRRTWRFLREDLDSSLRSQPVVPCAASSMRSEREVTQ
jgi:excisionase family DNA binding protein